MVRIFSLRLLTQRISLKFRLWCQPLIENLELRKISSSHFLSSKLQNAVSIFTKSGQLSHMDISSMHTSKGTCANTFMVCCEDFRTRTPTKSLVMRRSRFYRRKKRISVYAAAGEQQQYQFSTQSWITSFSHFHCDPD